jgi:hypothetical protein
MCLLIVNDWNVNRYLLTVHLLSLKASQFRPIRSQFFRNLQQASFFFIIPIVEYTLRQH